ncbi:MAG TPA: polysaccharide biosynthesis tyrosine autokinase [Tissierellia bacterium]|nr:polysaccharide biosynthesis tyrosine autokinase [Tissierellia bacterium]
MEEISLRDYFLILKKRRFLIIIITVLAILAANIGTKIIVKPEYKSSTTLIIKGSEKVDSESDQSYLNEKLIKTYSEIVNSRLIKAEVGKNLNIDLNTKDIIQKVDVEIIPDTDILKIEVTGSKAELVAKVADEIANVSAKEAKNMISIEKVEVVDEAQVPKRALNSNTKKNTIIGLILGLVISIFLAFLFEYLDNTIRTPKDISRHLRLLSIGILPRVEELVVFEKPNSFESESYRILNTNIQAIKRNKDIRTILITSSNSDEERDIVSINMGLAMAEKGDKVLLIDGNLRDSKLHTILNIDNKKGLSNILNEDLNYEEVINRHGTEKNLHIITSGSDISNPSELLAKDKMEDLIKELKNEYDTIILNSPAIGAISDALTLSTISDGTILVCEAEKTEVEDVKKGKEILEKAEANILGIVLNKVDVEKDSYYKYYYKNYSYYKD